MKRALISVSDKTGIVDFAKRLSQRGIEIISTGGTKVALEKAGISVKSVENITKTPAMFDGRVKTLHPKIHGGILGRRHLKEDQLQAKTEGIVWIDLVVVNLYPFKKTLQENGASHEKKIENIDIGGPTLIRAAAKNYEDVLVVCDPKDYNHVIEAVEKDEISIKIRQNLAGKAFEHTAHYDALIAEYFRSKNEIRFPQTLTLTWERHQTLRYGENPHQRGAAYKNSVFSKQGIWGAQMLHGKVLSYNNLNDADSALALIKEFEKPTALALKHTNPCGVGSSDKIEQAFEKARDCDPISIFGGIVTVNRPLDLMTAKKIQELFIEIVIAPEYTKEALEILRTKKNLRILSYKKEEKDFQEGHLRGINGGVLVQDFDEGFSEEKREVVTNIRPTKMEKKDMEFAWKVAKHIKSNGIVIAKNLQTLGIGTGQVNRIWAVEQAIAQSRFELKGSVMASDGFFPFSDGLETAAKAGISAIIQPGGSVQDSSVIKKANELGVAIIFTGFRHFKH